MTQTEHKTAIKEKADADKALKIPANKAEKNSISTVNAKSVRDAEESHYLPNEIADRLPWQRTNSIGLIVPDISNPFFSCVTRGIQNLAHKCGYSLIVCDTNENTNLEIEHINLLVNKGIDGMIVLPVGQKNAHIKKMLTNKIPLVLVDRCFEELDANSVQVDNYQGAFEATEYLVQNGHTKIAIIQGLADTCTCKDRLRGYLDALENNGILANQSFIVGSDFRRENGYTETKILLNLEKPPTAIFTTSDLITLGALQAIHEENFEIPEKISVVAFDDFDFAPFLSCPLTAVSQPKEIMGEIAVKLLIEKIKNDKKENKKILLKPKIVIRKSVKDISVNHN